MMKTIENGFLEEFYKLDTKESLVQLLNNIYNNFGKISNPELKGKKYFTEKQINFYLHNLNLPVTDDEHKLYSEFEIQKKSGSKRIIHAPSSPDFKDVLSCIDYLIRSIYQPHSHAFGFIEGRNIADNARLHLQKNYVYNIDLKDFFHSFDLNRIKLSLFNKPFNLKDDLEPLAYILASLVTCNLDGRRVLPQGSPVSPALTNHICWRLDQRLTGLAKRFGITYSRYADDITFSSNHNVYYGEFLTELKRIIHLEKLEINTKKTRLQKRGERQEVTGITVNEGLNVSKRYVKQLRMYLNYCEKYGIEKASDLYCRDYQELRNTGELFSNPGNLENILKGKLNYLSMVKGKDDAVYVKLANRYNLLFKEKTSKIDEIILHWLNFGIDSARKKYYEDQLNEELSSEAENIDFEDQQQIISEDKILEKALSTKQLHPFELRIFDLAYGFQFKNKQQRDSEYEALAEKLVINSIRRNKDIKQFMDKIDVLDYDAAIDFLKDQIKKDTIFYGSPFARVLKEGVKDYYQAFIIYKDKLING